MKKNNIEINILTMMLIEAIILLFFFKESLLNILISSIIIFFLLPLINHFKRNKLFDVITFLISLLIIFFLIKETSIFITYNLLKYYSTTLIVISIIITTLIVTKNGYHTFIKTLEICSYFYLLIKLISFILIIPNIDITNFNNTLLTELTINNHIIYITLFLIFILISIKSITNKLPNKKMYTVSFINPLIMKTIIILVIGKTLFNLYPYPYVNVLKRIKYLDFIERMEGILSFEYLFCFFFTISFFTIVIKNVLKNEE